jgi:uncharacterized membrane protein YqaE (UPF0057 family)
MSDEARSESAPTKLLIEAEYLSLRGEILKRFELRQQLIAILLTLAGIFLGVGVATETVALVYPPLAMFLAFGWAQNDYRIRDLARYIREELERPETGLKYETHVQMGRVKSDSLGSWRFVVFSHGGTFVFTQLMAVGIELAKMTFNPLEWALLGLDVIAILVVLRLIRLARR